MPAHSIHRPLLHRLWWWGKYYKSAHSTSYLCAHIFLFVAFAANIFINLSERKKFKKKIRKNQIPREMTVGDRIFVHMWVWLMKSEWMGVGMTTNLISRADLIWWNMSLQHLKIQCGGAGAQRGEREKKSPLPTSVDDGLIYKRGHSSSFNSTSKVY